ncbi:SgcJ/EcaC family oxidoreductase [Actinosynnema sp. NPDC059335]|uniref:SgcJ/EcaC family oxidoreductase n=1 Tax=Actinosynnema sp. NPDC059335 TaxID=3346804 RepID=UPI00366B6CBA
MQQQDDRAAVSGVIDALVEAWAAHDADAYGALFTEDATYVTYVGTHYQGRHEIAESHRTLWSKFLRGTRLADEVLDVRFPTPDTAIVTGRGDTYKGRPPAKPGKVQTYVLVREGDGRWRIAAFHNTKRRPLMEAVSFKAAPGLVPAASRR